LITTTLGPIDEALLIKREDLTDNENETTAAVEYCLIGCRGAAHVTGQADTTSHFCNQHVHRSVHVTVKKTEAAGGVVAGF
jgi:hypothetical protein